MYQSRSVIVDPENPFEVVRGDLYKGVRGEIRNSQSRRRYLEKVACIVSGQDLSVRLKPTLDTARIDMEEKNILVSSKEYEQAATELPPNVFDLIMQEGLLLHEVAHALWSDGETLKSHRNQYRSDVENVFFRVWNTLEDGAIERQLDKSYNVRTELQVMNATLGHSDRNDAPPNFTSLILSALYDLAIYDTGYLRAIREGKIMLPAQYDDQKNKGKGARGAFEDFLREAKHHVSAIKSETNGTKRCKKIKFFFDEVVRRAIDFQRMDEDEMADPNSHEAHNADSELGESQEAPELDGEQESIEQEMQEVISGSSESEQDDADDEEKDEGDNPGNQDEDNADDEQDDGDDADDGSVTNAGDQSVSVDEDDVDAYADEVKSQMQSEGIDADEMQSGYERLQESKENAEERGTLTILSDPNDPDKDAHSRYNQAKDYGRMIGRDLESRLQRERRAREETALAEGSFDSSRMIPAARGDHRVFKQLREGDEKDYSFVVVFDRSGSMELDSAGRSPTGSYPESRHYDGEDQLVFHAETAMGAMLAGLEYVNVDTEVIEMLSSRSHVAKHWHETLDQAQEKIFRGECGGRTPLHQTIAFAIEEAKQRRNGVVLVISDGEPDNTTRYEKHLQNSTVPVVGLYVRPTITDAVLEHQSWFHRQETCTDPDEMLNALQRLVRGILL